MSANGGPILTAEGLVKVYDRGRVRALDGLDLEVATGEFVSIIGPSGSGKSTLLQLLGALDRPDEGRVTLDGHDLGAERRLDRVRARLIGFIFQLHNLIPALNAWENVELPLRSLPVPRAERRRRAVTLLDAVGLADRRDHRPTELSGGERQRVAIARSLVNEPKVILADEPTGDLDQDTSERIMALLQRLQAERDLTLVMVTHDLEVAARAARTIRIRDGRVDGKKP
jgi:putative ABC transport system ATP-binding protein